MMKSLSRHILLIGKDYYPFGDSTNQTNNLSKINKYISRYLPPSMAVLLGWIFLLMLVAPLLGVQWFNPGDFEYREAMYYHGIGISAWMLLILVSARMMLKPLDSTATTAINFGSVIAGFLAESGVH